MRVTPKRTRYADIFSFLAAHFSENTHELTSRIKFYQLFSGRGTQRRVEKRGSLGAADSNPPPQCQDQGGAGEDVEW